MKTATVTAVEGVKLKVRFNEDVVASNAYYSMLMSCNPTIGDTVLMMRTSTSYICIGVVKK